jgi:hypothetical protein
MFKAKDLTSLLKPYCTFSDKHELADRESIFLCPHFSLALFHNFLTVFCTILFMYRQHSRVIKFVVLICKIYIFDENSVHLV